MARATDKSRTVHGEWPGKGCKVTLMISVAWCQMHDACYSDERLARILPKPMALIDFLRRDDIPAKDRVLVATRVGVMTPLQHADFARRCAGRVDAVDAEDAAGWAADAATRAAKWAAREAEDAAGWAAVKARYASADDECYAAAAADATAGLAAMAAAELYTEFARQVADLIEILNKEEGAA